MRSMKVGDAIREMISLRHTSQKALAEKLDPDKKNLIVYVDESFDQKEILNRVCNAAGYRAWRPLFESRCKAYELMR